MGLDFSRGATLCKALSDETRVKIVHILSCGERCACDLQEYFDITQPTLSHHLATLTEAGIIAARADGKWVHYRLNSESGDFLHKFMDDIFHGNEKCLCKKMNTNARKRGCDER